MSSHNFVEVSCMPKERCLVRIDIDEKSDEHHPAFLSDKWTLYPRRCDYIPEANMKVEVQATPHDFDFTGPPPTGQ
eukprot:5267614-Pleurochrysis_carterae.AAC.1